MEITLINMEQVGNAINPHPITNCVITKINESSLLTEGVRLNRLKEIWKTHHFALEN